MTMIRYLRFLCALLLVFKRQVSCDTVKDLISVRDDLSMVRVLFDVLNMNFVLMRYCKASAILFS